MNERVIGHMVRYEDPTTGEYLYRARTKADGVLPGDKFVKTGVVRPNPQCGDALVVLDGLRPLSTRDLFGGLEGRRVRVTVEVLP